MQHLRRNRGEGARFGQPRAIQSSVTDSRFNQPPFHLSHLFSIYYALFCTTRSSQLLCNQSVPHSFPCNGGVASLVSLLPYFLISLLPCCPEPAQRFQLRVVSWV